ncbi:MAG: hypothetical protein A2340_13055, partial [Lentisphaerae bacterium RIFOXYB12_FULL_60_10]
WAFANVILTIQALIVLLTVAALVAFPDAIVRLMTAWSPENAPRQYGLTIRALRWLAPAIFGLSMASTTYVLLNGYKRFFLAAFGDAVWRLCVMLCVGIGMGIFGFGIRSLFAGLLAGSALKLLTHLVGLFRELRHVRWSLDIHHPAVRQMAMLALPLLAGILFARFRDVFNNVYILSYLKTEGLIQANSIGRKLFQTIGFLIPYAFSIGMFPYLCEMSPDEQRERAGRLVTDVSRLLLSIFIPLSLVIGVMAYPLCGFLFGGGEFGPEAVRRTAWSTACYTLVLPAFSLEYLLMQAFFAQRRMIAISVTGMVFVLVSIGISAWGILFLGLQGMAALGVVAGGYVVSRTMKSLTLIILLKRHTIAFPLRETAVFLARTIAVGILTAIAVGIAIRLAPHVGSNPSASFNLLIQLILAAPVAGITFLMASHWFRLREPFDMLHSATQWVRNRMKNRSQQPVNTGGT